MNEVHYTLFFGRGPDDPGPWEIRYYRAPHDRIIGLAEALTRVVRFRPDLLPRWCVVKLGRSECERPGGSCLYAGPFDWLLPSRVTLGMLGADGVPEPWEAARV